MNLYLHIPFCFQKCNYCDFYSIKPTDDQIIDKYIDTLLKEYELYKNNKFTTIYIGGGNPAILEPHQLVKLKLITEENKDTLEEVTIELNPENINKEKLNIIKEIGVNRLSIGFQSSNNDELKFLGRKHTFEKAKESYNLAKEMGFNNINIDVIYGYPTNTMETFYKTIDDILKLNPQHISAYEYYRDTNRNKWFTDWKIDEDIAIQFWDERNKMLSDSGYQWYEISNFCSNNVKAIHNYNIWRGEDYVGLGAAAHSRTGNLRWSNIEDVSKYVQIDNIIKLQEKKTLTKEDLMFENVMLGLRLIEGIDLNDFYNKFEISLEKYFEILLKEYKKYFNISNENISLNKEGLKIYDYIISEIWGRFQFYFD